MDRRKDPKAVPQNYQAKRREAALQQQRHARGRALDRARQLALATPPPEQPALAPPPLPPAASPATEAASSPPRPAASVQEQWAAQLMQPEWLVEVPPDLASHWFVLPRPEGQRCLVVASRGCTVARSRTGRVLDRFQSALPAGGPGSRGSEHSILDCILHEGDSTYYVLGKNSSEGVPAVPVCCKSVC